MLVDTWVIFSLDLLLIKMLWTFLCSSFCGYTFSSFLDEIMRNCQTGLPSGCDTVRNPGNAHRVAVAPTLGDTDHGQSSV